LLHGRWNALSVPAFILPAALLIVFVVAYARSYPVWETWFFIPVWEDFRSNGPWISDLFISRWGHISAIPNFINLMIDASFNYDQRVDMYFIVVTALVSLYLLLTRYITRTATLTQIFLGATFLSLRAAEVWLDGWNIAMSVPLLISLAAGACILRTQSWGWLTASALLTWLGINAGGYCLPVIPAVLATLIVQAILGLRGNRTKACMQLCAWFAWSLALYLYWTYMRGNNADHLAHTLLQLDSYVSVVRELAFALGTGIFGLAALAAVFIGFLLCLPSLSRSMQTEFIPALVFLFIYSGVLAVLIVTERTHNGAVALHTRYIPFLCLLPAAILAFAEQIAIPRADNASAAMQLSNPRQLALYGVLCALIVSAVYNDYDYYRSFVPAVAQVASLDRAYQQSPGSLTTGMFLYRSSNDPELIDRGLATMKRLRLGPFGQSPPAGPLPASSTSDVKPAAELERPSFQIGIDQMQKNPDGNLVIVGWAFDPGSDTQLQTAYARLSGGCQENALVGLPRSDVAKFFKTKLASSSGWMVTFPARCMASHNSVNIEMTFTSVDGHWTHIDRAL
jgi:hypothetical protein